MDSCHVADCRLRVSLGTDGRRGWLASVPTLHSRRILPQPRCSGSYLARNGCPLAVDRLHSRSLKGKDACWTAHFDLRLNADDVTAAPSGGFSSIGEAAMTGVLNDLLLFSCLAAFVTGVVLRPRPY